MSENYVDIDQAVEKGGLHAGVALALHRENKQLRAEVARLTKRIKELEGGDGKERTPRGEGIR